MDSNAYLVPKWAQYGVLLLQEYNYPGVLLRVELSSGEQHARARRRHES